SAIVSWARAGSAKRQKLAECLPGVLVEQRAIRLGEALALAADIFSRPADLLTRTCPRPARADAGRTARSTGTSPPSLRSQVALGSRTGSGTHPRQASSQPSPSLLVSRLRRVALSGRWARAGGHARNPDICPGPCERA